LSRRRLSRWLFPGLGLVGIALFLTLGVWQVERREWKLALIDRVERRIHAAPVAPPGPAAWAGVDRAADEYRRVAVSGDYLQGEDTLVKAVTELGGGSWVITPLRTDTGFLVLVNRGFVPPGLEEVPPPPARAEVRGLLRISEPGGGFLRENRPAEDRWYSRDVAAIAAARGIGPVAPYFIDAEARGRGWPRGGLTVVRFRNSHLVYALTWFALAALLAFALVRTWRLR
jgi:surfeit locus 1 family protein